MKINKAAIDALPEPQKREAQELLERLEGEYRRNPLLRYEPHPKQKIFHSSRQSLKAFFGGNRSGKTTAGILDDLIQAVDADLVPESLRGYKKWEPPFYCRIIVPDTTSTLEGVVLQKIREWCPSEALYGGGFGRAYDKANRKLNFENGSWFDFKTFEQDLDKFGGAALHRVHYDEEPPRDIRGESIMRLIDYGGDELFTMTPLKGMSWMYDEIWVPHQKGTLADSTVVTVSIDDNPHLNEKTKRKVLANFTAEEREARKDGKFVHFAGLIYSDFDRYEHVVPQISKIPANVNVYVGIDPGMRHMAAVVWAYLTETDEMVVFDELALQGNTVEDVCRSIQLVNMRWGENGLPIVPRWNVLDPSARNVMHQTGRSDQQEFARHGVVTILGQNAVTAGISAVRERLKQGKLHIAANCVNLIDEFKKYRWRSNTMRSENEPKEEPVKKDDHLLDALRYVVMSMPLAPDPIENETLTPLEKAWKENLEGRFHPGRKRIVDQRMGGIFQ